jgi:hypothetical protein
MYTEDVGNKMNCILSKEMYLKLEDVYYNGEIDTNKININSIKFKKNKNCITSKCEFWHCENDTHGYCNILKED